MKGTWNKASADECIGNGCGGGKMVLKIVQFLSHKIFIYNNNQCIELCLELHQKKSISANSASHKKTGC